MLRRLVLNVMNWTTRLKTVNGRRIVVLDDSMSVIKVSPTLKNPEQLACLLEAIIGAIEQTHGSPSQAKYP